jgi:hypothetical protein
MRVLLMVQGQDSLAPGLVHDHKPLKPKKRKTDNPGTDLQLTDPGAAGEPKKRGRKKKETEVKIDVNTLPLVQDEMQISEGQSNQWLQ